MPQEFMVLKCHCCSMFQVHQVRKTKVWNCKLCNEKQSQQKVYGQGTGKECRLLVQQLNMRKREKEDYVQATGGQTYEGHPNFQPVKDSGPSKWECFRSSSSDVDDDSERQMTKHDIKPIITSETLDPDEWSGCKRRKLGSHKTKQERHDIEFVTRRLLQPAEKEDQNFHCLVAPQIPKFTGADAVCLTKRRPQGTPTTLSGWSSAAESSVAKMSKWGNFAATGEESGPSSENDE